VKGRDKIKTKRKREPANTAAPHAAIAPFPDPGLSQRITRKYASINHFIISTGPLPTHVATSSLQEASNWINLRILPLVSLSDFCSPSHFFVANHSIGGRVSSGRNDKSTVQPH
jgi:hypothetical protein